MERDSPTSGAASPGRDGELVLRNEFAHVAVAVDHAAKHPRLRLEDLRSGQIAYLDPLELESLAWSPHSDLRELLDPSHRRWKHDD